MPRSLRFQSLVVFGLLTMAYTLAFLHRMSPTVAAADIMQDFQSSAALMGLLASAYFYPYAFMQTPCGMLTDRFGTRTLVSVALVVAAFGCMAFAFASNPTQAFSGRIVVGLGLALILVPANKALSCWFPAKDFVLATSCLLAISTGLGVLLAGTPLAMLTSAFGWRASFAGMALLTLIMGIAVWLFVRDSPKDRGLPMPDSLDAQNRSSGLGRQDLPSIPVRQALRLVFFSRDYWTVGIVFALTGAVFFSFSGLWVGVFITEVGGLSRQSMGTLISVTGVLSAAAPILFATMAQRSSSRKSMVVFIAFLTAMICLWGALRNGAWGTVEMCLWTGGLAFVCTAPPGLYFTVIKERFPLSISGTATGLVYTLPMLASALYQPLVGKILDIFRTGPVLDAVAFQPVLWLYCLSTGVAFLAALCMKPDGKADKALQA